jgi:cytochrome c peroxidase
MAVVGKQLFFDTTLSASGLQSCASCHDANNAYAAPNALPAQLGGVGMDLPGLRNTPSLRYVAFTPAFHFEADGTAVGGFFLDGRSPGLADQAEHPFFTPFEMANADSAALLQRLLTRPYLAQFKQVFGEASVSDPDRALHNIGQALAAFEMEDVSFHPFSSKFDFWRNGQAQLTAQELRGFALFNAPDKGNCAACHVSASSNGQPALFTDFTYDNVGIPRNWALAANSADTTLPYVPNNGSTLGAPNHDYYDMGMCGPLRSDIAGIQSLCGAFKVPSLRNVAIKQSYFHNGVFHSLQDVVDWYITRDTDPARWYVQADGVTPDIPYNDLPAIYRANVNVTEAPYHPASAPSLTNSERKDVIAFLCTLTDDYSPASPGSYSDPAQCQAAR